MKSAPPLSVPRSRPIFGLSRAARLACCLMAPEQAVCRPKSSSNSVTRTEKLTEQEEATLSASGGRKADAATFREGMSRVAATVHIVATYGPAGRAGLTVTAMTPVSDSPPTILVCVNRASATNRAIRRNGVFSVNVLPANAEALSNTFAGRGGSAGADRFEAAGWSTAATGAPILAAARVAFDCRLSDLHEVGSHSILIGTVVDIRLGDRGPNLGYAGRGYRQL